MRQKERKSRYTVAIATTTTTRMQEKATTTRNLENYTDGRCSDPTTNLEIGGSNISFIFGSTTVRKRRSANKKKYSNDVWANIKTVAISNELKRLGSY